MATVAFCELPPPALLPCLNVERGEALSAEDMRVGCLPCSDMDRRDRGGVVQSCRPNLQDYLPAEEETYCATALICAGVSFPLNAGITPPPFVT